MAELVVMNGAGNIARSVVSAHLRKNMGKYASIKLVDARPYRKSVYNWQAQMDGVKVNKFMARSADSLSLSLEGAKDVVYFTHDYVTMSSDKNSHLQAVAKLAKKQGVDNLVAVCPIESDLAWSEDEHSFAEKTEEAEAAALQANPAMTLFKTNLTFGPETHLIHLLSQCALVGKAPYKDLVSAGSVFKYAPIHTDDVAEAVGAALQDSSSSGQYTLAGEELFNLREIMNALERAADKAEQSTRGPMLPPPDYLWDFLVGTTNDVNLARMVRFYEANHQLIKPLVQNTWAAQTGMAPTVSFSDHYAAHKILEEDYAHPTLPAYKCAHLD